MKKTMEIIDECGCEGWVEEFVRAVATHANIEAEELVITEMDGFRITLWSEVFDETIAPEEDGDEPGDYIEKEYIIRYFIDDEPWRNFLISYFIYDVDDRDREDRGAYKIVPHRGKAKCIRLEDETSK